MRSILALLIATACCALFGCLPGGPVAPAAPPARQTRAIPAWFVDASLKRAIEDKGGDLASSGAAETGDRLASQLDRASCTLSLPSAVSRPVDLPTLYRRSVPGTLIISRIYYCQKCRRYHTKADATAFALTSDGACATNYHVFERSDDDSMMVAASAWGDVYPVTEVLAASRKDDVAIFRIDPGADTLTPIPLRTGIPAGSTVAVLSHPGGHFYSFSPGHVARRSERYYGMVGNMKDLAGPDPHEDAPPPPDPARLTPTLEITAEYGVGSSGGPVLDDRGNAVGMVSNTLPIFADRDRKTVQMSLHHCVPAESILALVAPPRR